MIYAKGVAYLVAWVALVVILMRVIVGPLWGSATDVGLVAAPCAFAAGVAGLIWLGTLLLKDLKKTDRQEPGGE